VGYSGGENLNGNCGAMMRGIAGGRQMIGWVLSLLMVFTVAAMGQAAPGAAGGTAQPLQNAHLVGVRAQLNKSLNAKKAKVGDVVVANPEAKVHLADGVDLKTNSELIGHVDTVKPSVDGGNSAISVTFDKAQLKDGRLIPIKATILWIGQPPNEVNPTLTMAPADRTTPGVGEEAGGSDVPPQQGYQGAEIAGMARHPLSSGGSQLPPGLSLQTNAIPDVNFSSDMGRSDSGWFRSNGKNVFVPGGTVMAFAIVILGTP
jgi:hypothetical protein